MGQRLTLAVQGKMDVVKINGYDDDDDDDVVVYSDSNFYRPFFRPCLTRI